MPEITSEQITQIKKYLDSISDYIVYRRDTIRALQDVIEINKILETSESQVTPTIPVIET